MYICGALAFIQVILHKRKIVHLECQNKDLVGRNNELVKELNSCRNSGSVSISKLEMQLSEQTQHNLKLENDITRLTADFNHKYNQENRKYKVLDEKLTAIDADLRRLKDVNGGLEIKKSDLQELVMNSENKCVKLQLDFQKLRENSLEIAAQAADNHNRYVKRVEILNSTMLQYQKQLNSIQELNRTLLSQRSVLEKEINALKS